MCVNENKILSYHNFFFPIVLESTKNDYDKEPIDKYFENNKYWKSGNLCDKKLSKDEWIKFYAKNEYFHPEVREAILGYDDKFEIDKSIVSIYEFAPELVKKGAEYIIVKSYTEGEPKQLKKKEYHLDVSEISIRIFNTGIAILILKCINHKYDSLTDVKWINDYGRRISLPFIPNKKEEYSSCDSACADSLRLYIPGEDGTEAVLDATESFEETIQRVYKQEVFGTGDIRRRSNHVCNWLKALLEIGKEADDELEEIKYPLQIGGICIQNNHVCNCLKVLLEIAKKVYDKLDGKKYPFQIDDNGELKIRTALDERMYVTCLMDPDFLEKEIKKEEKKEDNKENKEESKEEGKKEGQEEDKKEGQEEKKEGQEEDKKEGQEEKKEGREEKKEDNKEEKKEDKKEDKKEKQEEVKDGHRDHLADMSLNYQERLYEVAYIDAKDCTCQSDMMREELLRRCIYDRWIKYGTTYTITPQAFICITSHDLSIASFLNMYQDMCILSLMQRASLIHFQDIALGLSKGLEEIGKVFDIKRIQTLLDLQERFIAFENQINLQEISSQEQAVELYERIKKSNFVDELVAGLKEQLDAIYDAANTNQDYSFNKWAMLLVIVSLGIDITQFLFREDGTSYLLSPQWDIIRLCSERFGMSTEMASHLFVIGVTAVIFVFMYWKFNRKHRIRVIRRIKRIKNRIIKKK